MFIAEEYDTYTDRNGTEFNFVRFIKPHWLLSWKEERSGVENICRCLGVRVQDVPPESLKELGIWDKLPKSLQKEVEEYKGEKIEAAQERMAKARKIRASYKNIPREFACIECKRTQEIAPGAVVKRMGKAGQSIEEFVANYKCQKCNPTKGRRSKKDYTGIPDQLVCKCGKIQKYHPSMIVKTAEKKGMTVDEYVKSYQCQKCNPTKGRKKGTKIKKRKGKK